MELAIKNGHTADVNLLTSGIRRSRDKVERGLLPQFLDSEPSRYGRNTISNLSPYDDAPRGAATDKRVHSVPVIREDSIAGLPSRVLLQDFEQSRPKRNQAEKPLGFIPNENIVSSLHSKKSELLEKLCVLQKSLEELKALKSHAINEAAKFESHISHRISGLTQQREAMLELQRELSSVGSLETRIRRARGKVEECQSRLTHVSQQVRIQENDNKQRKVRIQYVKRGTFFGLLVIIALCAVMQNWLQDRTRTRSDSFYAITDCLQDLDSC